MTAFEKKISLRWADIDPNFHLRHSVYYDLGAEQRIEILEAEGLTLKYMKQHHIGPVIFREECIFRREIQLGDDVRLTAKVAKLKPDASRWSIEHEFLRADNKLLATLTVEGAWIDTSLRKLASPIPQLVIDVFNAFPKAENFVLI
jgi:acyl-CoA thioester hydrolase